MTIGGAVVVVVLCVIGVYSLMVYFVKKWRKCTHDQAVMFIVEVIKDVQYKRYQFWLEKSEFVDTVFEEVGRLISEQEMIRWKNKLSLKTIVTQEKGVENGIPFYRFVMPWNENYEKVLREIIEKAGMESLEKAKCLPNCIKIDFRESILPRYIICNVSYARTSFEQERFWKILEKAEEESISEGMMGVVDLELDGELNNVEKGKYDEK